MLPQHLGPDEGEEIHLEYDTAPEPFYPPHHSSTESSSLPYPPDTTRSAVGPLGRSKQETIDFVQKAFPELIAYEPDRISFRTASGAVVIDEAWPHFDQDSPASLKIVIDDAPVDWEERQKKDDMITYSVIGGAMFVMMALFFLLRSRDEAGKA